MNTYETVMGYIKDRILFFDGGMGTLLQEAGLRPGELPENWNIERPEDIIKIHSDYYRAGSNIVTTNTFGANPFKYNEKEKYNLEEIIKAAVNNAKKARETVEAEGLSGPHFIAFDMSATGKLLEPLGDLEFEKAVEAYTKTVKIAAECGVDLVIIETMSDLYEAKAALLACKETTDLPVFVTVTYDENHRLLTGSNPQVVSTVLEGLGADAVGINCGLGPVQMESVVKEIIENSSVPVVVNPNAGLPRVFNNETVFDISPEEFARLVSGFAVKGAQIIGGCCGTTPKHIELLVEACKNIKVAPVIKKKISRVASSTKTVEFGIKPVMVGERINPTGKAKLKQALRNNDMDFIVNEALLQQEKGANVLDVNVGLPEIDEPAVMEKVVKEIQSISNLPLQIDTTNTEAMERALRKLNGKAMINSVNGKEEVMKEIFPLVKKYGGVVVALLLDENGIPEDTEGRIKIAKKIVEKAAEYGIEKHEIIFDPLAMAVSSDDKAAIVTLETVKRIKEELNGNSILGISNISFGLPNREVITSVFFTMAMQNGLSAAIMNPNSEEMWKALRSFNTLSGNDKQCLEYIEWSETYVSTPSAIQSPLSNVSESGTKIKDLPKDSLEGAITRGLKKDAMQITLELLENTDAMDIINGKLIPALDIVGSGFEKGKIFLPQLLMSADAASECFAVIKEHFEKNGIIQEKKGRIILATVKGDIHDIGKNIVKVLLENYGFEVIDLGKDVSPELVVKTCIEEKISLVGLSALMTTTVPAMEETIKLLRNVEHPVKVMVGGAVLTPEYAQMVGADRYAKDAMESVKYAEEVFKQQ